MNDHMTRKLAAEGIVADVMAANNVLAHGPDISGFVAGVPLVLAPDGVATFEFPHVMRLIDENQFDTMYHEHWSYLSLTTTQRVFASVGLEVFDVEELPSHGGSLRLFVRHRSDDAPPVEEAVPRLLAREAEFGLKDMARYEAFSEQVKATKRGLLSLLVDLKDSARNDLVRRL